PPYGRPPSVSPSVSVHKTPEERFPLPFRSIKVFLRDVLILDYSERQKVRVKSGRRRVSISRRGSVQHRNPRIGAVPTVSKTHRIPCVLHLSNYILVLGVASNLRSHRGPVPQPSPQHVRVHSEIGFRRLKRLSQRNEVVSHP